MKKSKSIIIGLGILAACVIIGTILWVTLSPQNNSISPGASSGTTAEPASTPPITKPSSSPAPESALAIEPEPVPDKQIGDQEEMSGMVEPEVEERIKALGLSSGRASYQYKLWDYAGRELNHCKDELFEYTIRGDGHILSGRINFDIRDELRKTETVTLSTAEYLDLAATYMAQCLPAFDPNHTTMECDINDDLGGEILAEVSLTETQGDIRVNAGTITFSRGGTLIEFRGSNNSIKDFEGKFLTRDEIQERVLQFIRQDNPTVTVPNLEYRIFNMSKYGDAISWHILVYVPRNPDESSMVAGNLYDYSLDAKTGEVLFGEVFPQFNP